MTIADVYDALVSKRVYKESMSFEKADQIMMEGMGSQSAASGSSIHSITVPLTDRNRSVCSFSQTFRNPAPEHPIPLRCRPFRCSR